MTKAYDMEAVERTEKAHQELVAKFSWEVADFYDAYLEHHFSMHMCFLEEQVAAKEPEEFAEVTAKDVVEDAYEFLLKKVPIIVKQLEQYAREHQDNPHLRAADVRNAQEHLEHLKKMMEQS
jgi:hypothetical protein